MSGALDRAVLDLMRRATEQAILPHYKSLSRSEISDKAPNDVVTVADHASEAILTEGLMALTPGVAIVGEEAVAADPSVAHALSGDCWIVDPLDGTNNFAAGKPPFGVLIARASGGYAQSGYILDCLTGRTCVAHRGKGATVDGERIEARVSGRDRPVAAISTVFMDQAKREAIKRFIEPYYELVDIPRCAAEQYPRLALGTNDVAVFERTLAWDHAAGTLWLNEAGGKVARIDGSAYRVDDGRTGMVGAATPELFEDLAARLDRMS